jgi:integrase
MRARHKLSAKQVEKLIKAGEPGKHRDGQGLFLHIREDGSAQWYYRFDLNRRETAISLGPTPPVTLAQAREHHYAAWQLKSAGINPKHHRDAKRQAEQAAALKLTTVRQVMTLYLAKHESKWSNAKHRREWQASLDRYAMPAIGKLGIAGLETAHVLKCIEPHWQRIPETMHRVLGRLAELIDYATVAGMRSGENPARWSGHLDALLPAPSRIRPVKHHAALHYREVPAFMRKLRAEQSIAARALELLILTGARMSEAIYAQWDEIDWIEKTWTIPAARMKKRQPHTVPLSQRALAILAEMRARHDTWIFPGHLAGKPISDNSVDKLLKKLACSGVTTHGFRSSFRTWTAERTAFPEAVAEQALAHAVKGAVLKAYKRTTLIEQRQRLMQQWSAYCENEPVKPDGKVVALRE